MTLFWIISLIFSTSIAAEQETSAVGVQEMMRYQALEGIEALRNLKERAERSERENNSLAPLAEEIVRDSFDAELQSKVDMLYTNHSDLSKELKFVPVTYNCGKDFDIYKLLEQVKRQKNSTTESPKCLEEFLGEDTVCTSASASTVSQSVDSSSTLTTNFTTPADNKFVSTPKNRSFKKGDMGRKVSEAFGNNSPVVKSHNLEEKLSNKTSLSNGQSINGSHQYFTQPENGNAAPLIINPTSGTQAQKSQPPQIANKPVVVVKQPLQGKATAEKALLGKLPSVQMASPTLKSSAQVKYSKNVISSQQNVDDESLLAEDSVKIPQKEYLYSE